MLSYVSDTHRFKYMNVGLRALALSGTVLGIYLIFDIID